MGRVAWLPCLFALGCAQAEEAASAESPIERAASYTLEISPAAAANIDEPSLRREIEAAIALYRRDVAAPTATIPVVVDTPDCLRTGYDMTTRKVVFCSRQDTPRAGTASADVIHHELFHALLCQAQPSWCRTNAPREEVALHEGLADFFAFTLAPDDLFGEGFYVDRPFIRRYRAPLCYSLVDGGHEKGNAIVSRLVARGRGLADVARFVAGPDFTLNALFDGMPDDPCLGPSAPQVDDTIIGYPASTLNRYRIRRDAPLVITFAGDEAFRARYPKLAIRWEPSPPLFAVETLDPTSFRIAVTGTEGFNKVAALFVVDGVVVGGRSYYFQIARP